MVEIRDLSLGHPDKIDCWMDPEGSIFQKKFTQYSFHLPKYQRKYEWVEEQWEDFWSSILEAYGSDINTFRDVFLGFFVFQQANAGDSILIFVDGQQRIVTIFLLPAEFFHKAGPRRC